MATKIYTSLITAICLLLMSCEGNEELSDVAIFVSPSDKTESIAYSGDRVLYDIRIATSNENLKSLQIISFDSQNGQISWLDMECSGKSLEYSFVYTAPEFTRDDCIVTFDFIATDIEGNRASVKRILTVKSQAITIAEKTGIVLYSPTSGLPDALSLSEVTNPFNLNDSSEPDSADIFVEANSDFMDISWHSNTKIKFLRFNSFNYPGATGSSISSTFKNSIRTESVSNIQVNDIILVGHGDVAEGVFFVSNIIRNAGTPQCIHLNYKAVVARKDNEDIQPDQPTHEDAE